MKFNRIILILCLVIPTLGFAKISEERMQQIYFRLINVNQLKGAPLYISSKSDINAYAYDDRIIITKGALRNLNEAELAQILGHELAHYNHLDSLFPIPGHYKEDRADYYATRYAEKVGYNKCQQATIFLKFIKLYNGPHDLSDPHSSSRIRYERIHKGCK